MSLPYTTKGKNLISFDGKAFQFDPESSQSRRRALQKLNEHSRQILETIRAKMGREPTYREILEGAPHADDLSVADRIKLQTRKVASIRPGEEDVAENSNPFRRLAAMPRQRDHTAPLEDRETRYAKLADEWDRRQAIEEAQRQFDSNPKRREAIDHASRVLWEMKYDPTIPQSQIEDAKFRLEIARRGPLSEYAIQHQKFQDWLTVRNENQRAALDSQIAELQRKRESIDGDGYSAPVDGEGSENEQ